MAQIPTSFLLQPHPLTRTWATNTALESRYFNRKDGRSMFLKKRGLQPFKCGFNHRHCVSVGLSDSAIHFPKPHTHTHTPNLACEWVCVCVHILFCSFNSSVRMEQSLPSDSKHEGCLSITYPYTHRVSHCSSLPMKASHWWWIPQIQPQANTAIWNYILSTKCLLVLPPIHI